MNELKVKCPNFKCCGIIARRDQIDKHYLSCWALKCNDRDNHEIGKCGLQIIECNNIGCNVKMQRSDLIKYHADECPFKYMNNNGNTNMNICTPSKENKRKLTQAELDRIKQNREKALERQRRWRLSQLSQNHSLAPSTHGHSNNNHTVHTQLTEEQKRRIEQNRQRAIERRRMNQMKLAMNQR